MKKLLLLLLMVAFVFGCTTTADGTSTTDEPEETAVVEEEVVEEERVMTAKTQPEVFNGDFSAGLDEWEYDGASMGGDAAFEVVDEVAVITIQSPGTELWSIGLYSMMIPLERKDTIQVTFDAKADGDTRIGSLMGMDRPPWTTYAHSGDINLVGGDDWKTFTYTFNAIQSDVNGQLAFELGRSSATTIYIDNVVVEKIGSAE